MMAARLSKIVLVAALALTCTLAVFGNVVDPTTNYSFVQHVLSMDTVMPGSGITDRSITDPAVQHAAFIVIVAGEAVTALLLWLGVSLMLSRLRAPAARFSRGRKPGRLPASASASWFGRPASWASAASGSACGCRKPGTARKPPSGSP